MIINMIMIMVKCGQKPHAYGCQTQALENGGKTIFQRTIVLAKI